MAACHLIVFVFFVLLAGTSRGSIDICKSLSAVLSNAVNEFLQHQEKNSRERRESNPGPQESYLCAMQPSQHLIVCSIEVNSIQEVGLGAGGWGLGCRERRQ